MRSVAVIAVFLLALPAFAQTADKTAGAEENRAYIYEWKDSQGIVHLADSLDKVPKQYRPSARRRESAPVQGPAGIRPGEEGGTSPEYLSPENDAAQKAQWQKRMRTARQALAYAQKRYQDLEQKRAQLLGQWGAVAYAPSEARLEAGRIAEEMQDVQREIAEAQRQVEDVIPEDARKAGVPPGWLRE